MCIHCSLKGDPVSYEIAVLVAVEQGSFEITTTNFGGTTGVCEITIGDICVEVFVEDEFGFAGADRVIVSGRGLFGHVSHVDE